MITAKIYLELSMTPLGWHKIPECLDKKQYTFIMSFVNMPSVGDYLLLSEENKKIVISFKNELRVSGECCFVRFIVNDGSEIPIIIMGLNPQLYTIRYSSEIGYIFGAVRKIPMVGDVVHFSLDFKEREKLLKKLDKDEGKALGRYIKLYVDHLEYYKNTPLIGIFLSRKVRLFTVDVNGY